MRIPVVSEWVERWKISRRLRSHGFADVDFVRDIIARQFGRTVERAVDPERANRGWVYGANRQIGGRAAALHPELYIARPSKPDRGRMGPPARGIIGVNRQGAMRAHWSYQPVHEHPFVSLLEKPNPETTGVVFHWSHILQLQKFGASYVAFFPRIVDGEFKGMRVALWSFKSMYVLHPNRVRWEPPQKKGERGTWLYTSSMGGSMPLAPAPHGRGEIEAWRQNPVPFVVPIELPGGSPVEATSESIGNLAALEQLHWNQLHNGVHAQLIFYMLQKGDDPKKWQQAVKLLKAGVGKAGEPTVLPKDKIEAEKSPVSNQEMQFRQLSELERQQALAGMGANDAAVGIGDNMNRATLWGLEHMLAVGAIDPLNALTAAAYNASVLPLYPGQSDTARLWMQWPSSKMVDERDQARVLQTLVKSSIMLPNEAREVLGLAPRPEGEKLLGVTEDDGLLPPGADEALMDLADADRPRLRQITRQVSTEEGREDRWRQLDKHAQKQENRFRRAIAGLFREMGEEIVSNLEKFGDLTAVTATFNDPEERGGNGWKGSVGVENRIRQLTSSQITQADAILLSLYTPEEWETLFRETYMDQTTLTVLAAVALVSADLGMAPLVGAGDPELRAFIASRAGEFSRLVNRTTRENLRVLIWESFVAGVDRATVGAEITSMFERFAGPRAAGIARTETTTAFGWGEQRAMEAAEEFDSSLEKMWLSERDGEVRDTHNTADGQVRSIREPFDVGGCQMMHPGDAEMCPLAEEIINCRCRPTVIGDA